MFQSLSRDSVYSNCPPLTLSSVTKPFQSLSRDSVYSNLLFRYYQRAIERFNPSVGIAFIQTELGDAGDESEDSFNPSVGIAFIQTVNARP